MRETRSLGERQPRYAKFFQVPYTPTSKHGLAHNSSILVKRVPPLSFIACILDRL